MKQIFLCLILLATTLLPAQTRLIVPIGHTDVVTCVAISPNGKYVLSGSADHTAKLWSRSGQEIQTFSGHTKSITTVAFSPKGEYILTGGQDTMALLWDLNGREIQTFKGKGEVFLAVFSPDGKSILLGRSTFGSSLHLWNLNGQKRPGFTCRVGFLTAAAFSPDGASILVGSVDKTAKLLDLTGNVLKTFAGHTGSVTTVAFSPDGKFILTGSEDRAVKLWDRSGREVRTFQGPFATVNSIAFSRDGKFVLARYANNHCVLWELGGKKIQTFSTGQEKGAAVFSPDGKFILTPGIGYSALLWDLTGKQRVAYRGHSSQVNTVAFSPTQEVIVTGGENRRAKLWIPATHRVGSLPFSKQDGPVVFSPDGAYILTVGSNKNAFLWDMSGQKIQSFVGHSGRINAVAFAPDGKSVLTGSEDNTAKIWNLAGQEIRSVKTDGDPVAVSFSPDGQFIITASDNNAVQKWPLSGQGVQSFTGHTKKVAAIIFSPDGKFVLTGGTKTIFSNKEDKIATLWDLAGRKIQSFTGHTRQVNAVAFSLDGKAILTGSDDELVKLWDVAGNQVQSLQAGGAVTSVAFSPDGKFIIAGSAGHTTKIWSRTGAVLATLIAIDSTDWAVIHPSGLFDASPGAMRLMHYVEGLEVISLEQAKERYYEPGLLAKVIDPEGSVLRDVAQFDKLALYPAIESTINKQQMAIDLTERNGGMGKLSLFINGKEVAEDINPEKLESLKIDLAAFKKYFQADSNTITLLSYNQDGSLRSEAYELPYRPATASPGVKIQPSLYALVVGTADYSGDQLDLSFADLDAEAMAKAIRSTGSALFGVDRTKVYLLSTMGKTSADLSAKANIQQAFAEIASNAKAEDIVMVFLSGHGLAYRAADKDQFYYLTKDIGSTKLDDKKIRDAYTISSEELTDWLNKIAALKQVIIIDACNAGKVVESLNTVNTKGLDPSQIRAFERMQDRTGTFVLTGSAADKVSYEATQYGQGLLTYSLLRGMSGLALKEGQYVDVMVLFQYSRDEVPKLAKGIGGVQTPVLSFPTGGASFDIGIVGAGVNIPVAQVKPVFIRSSFHDENMGDELDLERGLEEYFRQVTVKGAQAELIYVDVSEYESGYSIRGEYKLQGNAVEVTASLFKGKTILGKFQVTGKKGNLPGLVAAIVAKVAGLIRK